MPRTLTDEDVALIADAVTERLRRPYRRPAPQEILTGEEAASRLRCCYNTFKKSYVATGRIRPVATTKGRHGRGFTSASVEKLHREVFGLPVSVL